MIGNDRQEPTLDDLLNDPIVQILMRRDAVERWKLEEMIARVRRNRRAEADCLAACPACTFVTVQIRGVGR